MGKESIKHANCRAVFTANAHQQSAFLTFVIQHRGTFLYLFLPMLIYEVAYETLRYLCRAVKFRYGGQHRKR